MNYYVHNIDHIALIISNFHLGWYDLSYIISFFIGYIFIRINYSKKEVILSKVQYNLLILIIYISVIVGARLGYVFFYNPNYFYNNPSVIIKFGEGGMSFHGGMLGVILTVLIFCKVNKKEFYQLADPIMPIVAFGLGLGRVANFINGELYGKVTNVSWAVIFPNVDMQPRHPSQLYEALFEGFLMALFLQIVLFKSKIKGLVFWLFIFLYGVVRFLIEYIRLPDSHLPMYKEGLLLGVFTMGQILSLCMILSSIMVLVWFSGGVNFFRREKNDEFFIKK